MQVTWQKHEEYLNHGLWAIFGSFLQFCSLIKLVYHVATELSVSTCSGWLLISEVKSRFDPSNGGADPEKFIKAICELGFVSALKVYAYFLLFSLAILLALSVPFLLLINKYHVQDFSNKMFILLYFKKKVCKCSECLNPRIEMLTVCSASISTRSPLGLIIILPLLCRMRKLLREKILIGPN